VGTAHPTSRSFGGELRVGCAHHNTHQFPDRLNRHVIFNICINKIKHQEKTMSVVEWEKNGAIATIKLNNGPNPQNLVFAQDLLKSLEEIEADAEISSVVLTSNDPKNFSIGVDVAWVGGKMQEKDNDSVKAFMYGMNDVFKKILLFPVPVIAAINGHAFGNGAILSCACDFRFMRADRGYFCFPEVDLGIPFLPGMLAFVKKSFPYQLFNEVYLTGRRLTAPELAEKGVIEKACADPEALLQEAYAFAATFAKKRGIFTEHKKRLHKSIIETMDSEDSEFIDTLQLFIAN
jgi:enoyl-CoA hydratase/carnithine racemase